MIRFIAFSLLTLLCLRLPAQYYGVKEPIEGRWTVGLTLGSVLVNGDVNPRMPFPGVQLGLYGQKTVTRWLDFRFAVHGGVSYGEDTRPSTGYLNNTAWNGQEDPRVNYIDTAGIARPVYYNYRMQFFNPSVLFKFNFNRMFSPSGNERWDLYAMAGIGILGYKSVVDAFDENANAIYDFSRITATGKGEVRDQLRDLRDNRYETSAQQDLANKTNVGEYALSTYFSGALGFKIMVGQLIGLGAEARYCLVGDDLLDGQRWNNDNTDSSNNDRLLSVALLVDFNF